MAQRFANSAEAPIAPIDSGYRLVAPPQQFWRATMTLNEKFQIIVNAFDNVRYGISPTATRGAVQNHSKKHGLDGQEYTDALDAAMAAGLVAQMADSGLAIRNAGRNMLPKR
jgi:hypothetical protein